MNKDSLISSFLVFLESTSNAGDLGSIPGSGRSAGEGIGYPLRYSWVSLVAQLVKNPPAMWETWVQSLSWGDPLQKRKTNYSSSLVWRILWTTYSPQNSLGQNTGVGSLSLLQGIFLTQGSNPGLPHCRQILYQLSYHGRVEVRRFRRYLGGRLERMW